LERRTVSLIFIVALFHLVIATSARGEENIAEVGSASLNEISTRFNCAQAVQTDAQQSQSFPKSTTWKFVNSSYAIDLDSDRREVWIVTPSFIGKFKLDSQGPLDWYLLQLPSGSQTSSPCHLEFWDVPGYRGLTPGSVGFAVGPVQCGEFKSMKDQIDTPAGLGHGGVSITSINGMTPKPLPNEKPHLKKISIPKNVLAQMWPKGGETHYDPSVTQAFRVMTDEVIKEHFQFWRIPDTKVDLKQALNKENEILSVCSPYAELTKNEDLKSKIATIRQLVVERSNGSHAAVNDLKGPARIVTRLYDCSQKLSKIDYYAAFEHKNYTTASDFQPDPKSLSAYEASYLAHNLLYILDRYKRTLYIFTPYFAGKADLSHDKKRQKIEVTERYKLPVLNGVAYDEDTPTYRIRIPYVPDYLGQISQGSSTGSWGVDISRMSPEDAGYFYLTIRDMSLSGGPLLSHIVLAAQFLPGSAQDVPDFSHGHGWGEHKNYYSLNVEDRLWDKNAKTNFSSDAQDLLVSHIALRIKALRPLPNIGDTIQICPGAGCTGPYTSEAYEADHQVRQNAMDSCKSTADEFHLNLLQP